LGAIAAAFTKGPRDAEALVEIMLRAMKHRGAKPRTMRVAEDGKANLSVGYISQRAIEAQVFETNGTATMLDGSIFRTPHAARFAHTRLTRNLSVAKGARSLLGEPGAFACVFQQRKKLHVFRDLNGLKPLYYARSRNVTAFASERKALWAIGFKDTLRVNPGYLYAITEHRFS